MLKSIGISRTAGAFFTLVMTSLIIFLFFHRNIMEANHVSFASAGDGLKSTFGSLYHIQYDSTYWLFEGMNYPFGESVFFTGNQTFLTNFIKLLKDAGLDLSGHVLGILNLWMLFSFAFCALFLYLILAELGLPVWYSVAGSVVATFLSPQWIRMSGHYNLAYAWVIPLALFLLIRFYRKPGYTVSLLFGLFILAILGKHAYFLVMVMLPWAVFWFFLLIRAKSLYGRTAFLVPHLLIQMFIPVLLFGLFTTIHNPAADRTAYPWGFFAYDTRWVSVFLPLLRPYGRWIIVGPVKTLGYVGCVSTIVFHLSIALIIYRWIRKGASDAFRVTDKFMLNVFILSGVLCLLLALGYPFTWWPPLLNYTGPFRQFRAIGRFVIPFFYIMNIFTLYMLWRWYMNLGRSWFAGIVILALVITGLEAYYTVRNLPGQYYNKFETLNDRENILPDDEWVSRHDWKQYQAIMPMPYYHIGSENYWIGDGSPVTGESYIVSLKTGLPLNSVMLSRTSISQTLDNLDLYWEPGAGYPILEQFDPDKSILLLRHRDGNLNQNELRIIGEAVAIDSNRNLIFYRLLPDSLQRVPLEHAAWMRERAVSCMREPTEQRYIFESFDSLENGEFTGEIKNNTEFASCNVPDSGRFEASFWYEGVGRDLWPRTFLFISLFDTSSTCYYYSQTDFFRVTVMREGEWGLISVPLEVNHPGDVLKLTYVNRYLTGGKMRIDRVLVRMEGRDVVLQDGDALLLNNRPLQFQRIRPD